MVLITHQLLLLTHFDQTEKESEKVAYMAACCTISAVKQNFEQYFAVIRVN
jgi:hypothetical protein